MQSMASNFEAKPRNAAKANRKKKRLAKGKENKKGKGGGGKPKKGKCGGGKKPNSNEPKEGEEIKPKEGKEPKVGNELQAEKKRVHSRAYHQCFNRMIKEGSEPEAARIQARLDGKQAVKDLRSE